LTRVSGATARQRANVKKATADGQIRDVGRHTWPFYLAVFDDAARYGRPEIFNTDQDSQLTSAAFTGALAGESFPSFARNAQSLLHPHDCDWVPDITIWQLPPSAASMIFAASFPSILLTERSFAANALTARHTFSRERRLAALSTARQRQRAASSSAIPASEQSR
jgi:hypothetical protein